jgi:hypothetical protein
VRPARRLIGFGLPIPSDLTWTAFPVTQHAGLMPPYRRRGQHGPERVVKSWCLHGSDERSGRVRRERIDSLAPVVSSDAEERPVGFHAEHDLAHRLEPCSRAAGVLRNRMDITEVARERVLCFEYPGASNSSMDVILTDPTARRQGRAHLG